KRDAIRASAKDNKAHRGMNPLHQFMFMLARHAIAVRRRVFVIESLNPGAHLVASESCNGCATASGIQILCEINKEILGGAFNEDVYLTGAPETFARIETHQRGLTS